MTEDQLNKILDNQFAAFAGYMNKRFDQLEAKIDAKADREQVEALHGAVDTLSGHVQDAVIDNHARDAQLERHDQAITQLADQAGVKLQYQP